MIYVIIATAIIGGVIGVIALLPDIPPAPLELVAYTDTFAGILKQISEVYRYFMSPAIAYVTLFIILTLLAFDPLYKLTLWVLRKLPIGVK